MGNPFCFFSELSIGHFVPSNDSSAASHKYSVIDEFVVGRDGLALRVMDVFSDVVCRYLFKGFRVEGDEL